MLRGLSSVVSFLTIIPTGSSDLSIVARHMYLFPLVGMALGLAIGSAAFGLSIFLDPLIVGLIAVALVAILTGIHHADGLADFADGLAASGSQKNKIAAMKDSSTGSAGTVATVLCIVGLVVALSLSEGYDLFLAILLGEIMAKFSMVLMAGVSQPASQGSGSLFVDMMSRKKLFFSGVITLVPIMVLGSTAGLVIFGAGVTVTLFLLAISTRSFGGITGDALGATNELVRLTSVMVFVAV